MNKFNKIFLGAFFMWISSTLLAFNIGVAPVGFYGDLDKNETHEIMVTNNTNQVMRIDISTEIDKGWEKYDLGKMMKIFPKTITVRPHGKRSVRFAVRKKGPISDGEYKTLILFKEVSTNKGKTTINQKISEDVEIGLELLSEVQIEAFALKGKREVKGTFTTDKILTNEKGHKTLISNFNLTGNSALYVVAEIDYLNSSKRKIDSKELQLGRTTRDKNSFIETNFNSMPKGTKYIRINYKDGNGRKIGQSTLKV